MIRLLTLLLLLVPQSLFAEDVTLPAKEQFHLFLLAGQSNMAGRGVIEEQDLVPHPRVLMLSKAGQWVPAVAPIHFDKPIAGVGLAKSFALEVVKQNPEITIGLIPAACGGSSINSWVPGGYHGQTKSYPYDDAIKRTQNALEVGTLKAILWHQGESDSNPKVAPEYKAKLLELMTRFEKVFHTPSLPFLIGQLPQPPQRPWNQHKKQVNQAQKEIGDELSQAAFISSNDLGCNPDQVHFNAAALREFGKRYADAYFKLISK